MRDKSVLEWLFDPITLRVLTHFITFAAFGYDKSNLLRIHGCDEKKLDVSLKKLLDCEIIKIIKDHKTKYRLNLDSKLARELNKFLFDLVDVLIEKKVLLTKKDFKRITKEKS